MAEINPFEFFKEEMEQDEIQIRINAIHRLKIIATLMDVDQVKQSLLPYLEHLIKKEADEVLFAIAEELYNLTGILQGNQTVLLSLLEFLASEEEAFVREMAVKSLINISSQLSEYEILNNYIPLILRLANSEQSFVSKISSINLMCNIYPLSAQYKEKIRSKFQQLSTDQIEIVRRFVTQKIGAFSLVLEKEYFQQFIIQILKNLMNDEQDILRVQILDQLSLIVKLLKQEENEQLILPILLQANQDQSWKVRLNLSKILPDIFEQFQQQEISSSLIKILVNLLKDPENDVRAQAINSLEKFVSSIDYEQTLLLIPLLQQLLKDSVPQVRQGTVQVIGIILNQHQKAEFSNKLVNLMVEQYEDENKDVKLCVLETVCKYMVFYKEENLQSFIPLLKKSVEDQRWKIRLQGYNCLFEVSKALNNQEVFLNILEPLIIGYLKDRIAYIRENGYLKLLEIIKLYQNWAFEKFYKYLVDQLDVLNGYLFRSVSFYSIKQLGLQANDEILKEKILPVFYQNLNDSVSNIRFILVKILKEIAMKCQNQNIKQEIKNNIFKLTTDADNDVKNLANDAIGTL